MARDDVVFIDEVSGIVGMFIRKYPSNSKERRFIIEYKPATLFGKVAKVKKLPVAIPPDGIYEKASTEGDDGRRWVVIKSYGNDDLYPNLFGTKVHERMTDLTRQLDNFTVNVETSSEAIAAEKRIINRNKGEIVKDAVNLSKEASQHQKKTNGLFPINMGEE